MNMDAGPRRRGPKCSTLRSLSRCVSVAAAVATLAGCGTTPDGRRWGQDASFAPGWGKVRQAAADAATAPETWIPAVGAVAVRVGNADARISRWAARETPVFGSQENALRRSDDLRNAAGTIWVASALATPSGDSAGDWWSAKARGLAVQASETVVMRQSTGYLKESIGRQRPNGGDGSFPSLHSAAASSYATMSSRNIDAMNWSEEAKTRSRWGLGALTAATAWSRVEANVHYPSDVLAGTAFGHFLGAFFTDAFMGGDGSVRLVVESSRLGHFAGIEISF